MSLVRGMDYKRKLYKYISSAQEENIFLLMKKPPQKTMIFFHYTADKENLKILTIKLKDDYKTGYKHLDITEETKNPGDFFKDYKIHQSEFTGKGDDKRKSLDNGDKESIVRQNNKLETSKYIIKIIKPAILLESGLYEGEYKIIILDRLEKRDKIALAVINDSTKNGYQDSFYVKERRIDNRLKKGKTKELSKKKDKSLVSVMDLILIIITIITLLFATSSM